MAHSKSKDQRETYSTGNTELFLLDSNIIIYAIQGNKQVLDLLLEKACLISVISRLEVLMGAIKKKQPLRLIRKGVELYASLSVDTQITDRAFKIKYEDGVPLKFKDLLIAATAIEHDMTLVTADRDFVNISNLKTLLVKP